MSDVSVVPFDQHRAVVTGLTLPSPPPTRITISGHTYTIAAPRSVLPPLANTAKVILNWVGPTARIAKNIFYILKGAGSGSTSDPIWLNALASQVMSSWGTASINTSVHNLWTLQSVTAKDNGGTSAQSVSTVAGIPGGASGLCNGPGVSVCISWRIAEVYRGGKPRLYLPGIPLNATAVTGDSLLSTGYASGLDTAATAFMNDLNTHPVLSTAITLGTVSHFTAHAVRPVPVFRSYFAVQVHERLDSQRRRNGRESTFPVTPA